MKVYYTPKFKVDKNHLFDPRKEKIGDWAIVTRFDLLTNLSSLPINELIKFINDGRRFKKSHEHYQLLKELINSYDVDNCLIALEIINNI